MEHMQDFAEYTITFNIHDVIANDEHLIALWHRQRHQGRPVVRLPDGGDLPHRSGRVVDGLEPGNRWGAGVVGVECRVVVGQGAGEPRVELPVGDRGNRVPSGDEH